MQSRDCLKCTGLVGIILALEILLINFLDLSGPTINRDDLKTTAKARSSAFELAVSDECSEKEGANVLVSYTVPGKSFLPVLMITCSPNGPTFVPANFFKEHAQQNPIVRLANAEQESKYAVLLIASNEKLCWAVINVKGIDLRDGVVDWKAPDYHVLVEYNHTVESLTNVHYRFIVFKQRGKFGFRGSSEGVARVMRKLEAANMLTRTATASFDTGGK